MQQYLIELFGTVAIPLGALALPIWLSMMIAARHEDRAEATIAMFRDVWAHSELETRSREARKKAADRGFRDGGLVLLLAYGAEAFIAANWFAIGRVMFSD